MAKEKPLPRELSKALSRNLSGSTATVEVPEGVDEYLRPGGIDKYRRPGGVDLYKRPA